MPRAVAISLRARLQVMDTLAYLNSRSPTAGKRFTERLGAAYRQLSDFPLSGARGATSGTRRLVVAPYVLTYRELPAGIEIADIRHGRQRETSLPADI